MNLAEATVVAHLDRAKQLEFAELARAILASTGLLTPVSGRREMSVRITNAGALGWVADDLGYRYTSTNPSTGAPWPEIPAPWIELADELAGEPQPWDCAHLVWYGPEARLGWHCDINERDRTRPIVTICLGDDGIWAIREYDGGPVHRTRVISGDCTMLAGPTRGCPHTIERIEPALSLLAPSPLLRPGRLAISVRCAG